MEVDIYLKKAILHVIDRNFGDPVFSQVDLDLANITTRDFLTKKIEKLASAQTKTGLVSEDSNLARILQVVETDFESASRQLVEAWYAVYQTSEDAPSADTFVILYEQDAQQYVAFLKVDFHQGYTHLIGEQDGNISNDLIVHQSILSGKTQKADECFSVRLDNLSYELLEKRYTFSGEREFYLSTKVIESVPQPSLEESIKTVKKTAEKVATKFDVPKFEVVNQVKAAVQETIEEDQSIDTIQIGQQVFKNNPAAQSEFNDAINEQVAAPRIPVSSSVKEIATKKYGKQKLKLSNGIELTVPLEVYEDPNLIEFKNNPDGTISVMIKNVEKVVSRL